jgi:hypothetical protein
VGRLRRWETEAVAEFYGLPLIGQKQERPMNGAQSHILWVGYDGGRLIRNRMGRGRWLACVVSHPSSKKRSMDGAQFHLPWVGNDGGRLNGVMQ